MPDLGLPPPTVSDIFRYRYQHGTNLGSMFMHGPWLDNNVSERDLDGSKELEALKRDVARCTGFEGEPSLVYNNCWNILKRLIVQCSNHGIGVLIDLKSIPGGKDKYGEENSEKEITFHDLWGVIGVQISSEKDWRTWGHDWYDEVLEITSSIDPTLPIYINDGQNLHAALDYAILKNRLPAPVGRSPIIVESHKHFTSESDRSLGPRAIIGRVSDELTELAAHHDKVVSQGIAIDVYVGEWSCVMDDQTWKRVDMSERPELTKRFGQAQARQWASKACGSAFCSFKPNGMYDADMDYERQVSTGAIPSPVWLTFPRLKVLAKLDQAESQRAELKNKFLSQTSASTSPHGRRRFCLGWDLGFSDALNFFAAMARDILPGHRVGGDKIGAMELWIRKRVMEASCLGEDLDLEWENGFRTGVDDFYNTVGI
ncbi:hypothetical protein EYZ11_003521 [Aspergillus tanneri]|uniref:Uncharacterized protein n=1 Tax=Aspergillus tanneri TaxID=1220188 RepID=A0A4S3JQ88_9EURO|nr:hypothetical protein EYZ11_003521 [Aspergillus tanneri]